MKPYRLPSKKKSIPHQWGDATASSPRTIDFQQGHNEFPTVPFPTLLAQQEQQQHQQQQQQQPPLLLQQSTLPRVVEKHTSSDSDCSDILTPTTPKCSDKDLRLYLPKPRAVLQRRNTICGDQVSDFKNNNVMFWHERFSRDSADDSPSLRDKSISFGFGLEIAPRPTTCLGIGSSAGGFGKFADFGGALKGSLPDIIKTENNRKNNKSSKDNDGDDDDGKDVSKPGVSKVVRFDSNNDVYKYKDSKYSCNVENTILEVFEPIPYVDDEDTTAAAGSSSNFAAAKEQSKPKVALTKPPVMKRMIHRNVGKDSEIVEAVNDVLVKDQRFERSASVPAYAIDLKKNSDDDGSDSDDDSDDDFGIFIKFA